MPIACRGEGSDSPAANAGVCESATTQRIAIRVMPARIATRRDVGTASPRRRRDRGSMIRSARVPGCRRLIRVAELITQGAVSVASKTHHDT
jgi:hypothetical protein